MEHPSKCQQSTRQLQLDLLNLIVHGDTYTRLSHITRNAHSHQIILVMIWLPTQVIFCYCLGQSRIAAPHLILHSLHQSSPGRLSKSLHLKYIRREEQKTIKVRIKVWCIQTILNVLQTLLVHHQSGTRASNRPITTMPCYHHVWAFFYVCTSYIPDSQCPLSTACICQESLYVFLIWKYCLPQTKGSFLLRNTEI